MRLTFLFLLFHIIVIIIFMMIIFHLMSVCQLGRG